MIDAIELDLDFLPAERNGIYLVGGTVRDLLMGIQPADIDLVTGNDVAGLASAIAGRCRGRVVDLGGKKGFAVLRVASPSLIVDIARLEEQTIEANLMRRDFTFNAMAYDVEKRLIVDVTGGRSDLNGKIVRMVSQTAFADDPARLIRAYRMAAVLSFNIDRQTRDAIGRHAHLIDRVAGERIWSELMKLFATPASSPLVRHMREDGLLTSIFPELLPTMGCMQNRFHQYDVFEHSLRTYTQVEALITNAGQHVGHLVTGDELANLTANGALIKYAALLHDVGKPATRKVDADGRVHFAGHAGHGADLVDTISRRLRLSTFQRKTADTIVRNHIRPLSLFLAMQSDTLSRRGIVRFFNRVDRLTVSLIVHSMADCLAKHAVLSPKDKNFLAFCNRLLADYADFRNRQAASPPLIDGNDLITLFGLVPSPHFKRILRRVEERRLSGDISTRDEALAWVKGHLAAFGQSDTPAN